MSIIDEILLELADFTQRPYKSLYGELKKSYRAEALRIALARGEKKGLIHRSLDNEEIYIQLTETGQERLRKGRQIKKLLPWQEGWEVGSYCVVVFDIPEKNRLLRDILRGKLKEAGFVGKQRSVWVGKGINIVSLREFLGEIGLSEHVLAFETSSTGDEKLEKLLEN